MNEGTTKLKAPEQQQEKQEDNFDDMLAGLKM